MSGRFGVLRAFAFAMLLGASPAYAAEGGAWSVSKSTGDVWIASNGAQPVSLKQDDSLKPGDTVQTGRNGRVLLVRGEESMVISPNSVVGLPQSPQDGLATTIIQRAGSILLDVEKRNVKHFEVETPYLAAVVKGTQFSVTVGEKSTSVDVKRGQVEVSDFKTGQIAQVMPGQAATVLSHGRPGLVLSGAGTFNPVEQGKPRAPTVQRVPVPKGGLVAPLRAQGAPGARQAGNGAPIKPAVSRETSLISTGKHGGVRISAPIGEVKLDFSKVTRGLAHGPITPGAAGRAATASQQGGAVAAQGDSSASTSNTGQASSGGPGGPGGGPGGGGGPGSGGPGAAPPAAAIGSVIFADGPPGPDGKGPPGLIKKGGGPANTAGNGPPGNGPAGNGPPGHGGNGPPGHGGNGPPGHGGNGPPGHR